MLTEQQQQSALDVFLKLCAIPGGSGQEHEVADFIIHQLKDAGIALQQISFDEAYRNCPISESNTGNLFIKLDGNIDAPLRVLMAHMDTVPVCIGAVPKVEGELVVPESPNTGLGADNRAGVAVVLSTALDILRGKLEHPPLLLLFTVQEEIGVQGARHIDPAKFADAAYAFNWDGGNPAKLTVGAIGGYRMKIEIHGQASHAGLAPEKGISAITVAGLAIHTLQQKRLLGKIDVDSHQGTSNLGVIHGGTATNVVADHVSLTAEVRSHQVETIHYLAQQFREALESAASRVQNDQGESASVKFEGDLNYQPFRMEADQPCVQIAEKAIADSGLTPVQAVANGGLDANWLNHHGLATVSLGCGQANPHMTSERLEISKFYQACEIAMRIATGTDLR